MKAAYPSWTVYRMQSISTIALSGMSAATSRLGSSAHNLANSGTAGFRREPASQESLEGGGSTSRSARAELPGTAIETDMLALLSAKNSFLANLAVFRTADELA